MAISTNSTRAIQCCDGCALELLSIREQLVSVYVARYHLTNQGTPSIVAYTLKLGATSIADLTAIGSFKGKTGHTDTDMSLSHKPHLHS